MSGDELSDEIARPRHRQPGIRRHRIGDAGSLARCTDRDACWGVVHEPCPLHSPRLYATAGRHRIDRTLPPAKRGDA